jgi:LmbE family N-acetylglucosaminyl deacetylase
MNNVFNTTVSRTLHTCHLAGPVLVLAPHADDESLGCGGVIAALREQKVPVHVWLVSDGTMSHPNSQAFPPDRRCALRESEFRKACTKLGVTGRQLRFFRFPDTRVPLPGTDGFAEAVGQFCRHLKDLNPKTIFTPWRRDPHCDHQATTALILKAIEETYWPGELYEYPIWLYELARHGDAPHPSEVEVFTFTLKEDWQWKKKSAIETHRSQLGQLIHDDPEAFSLQPEVLAHFTTPTEYYYRTL